MVVSERSSVRRLVKRYLGAGAPPTSDDVSEGLWTTEAGPELRDESSETYSRVLVEQYKIYVEMADRVSSRRGLTNTFFLTLNTSIFAVIGAFWGLESPVNSWLLAFPVFALITQCMAWFWIVRSYRQLNAAKFAVVGAFEERLPASPFWRAEWKALGEGRDPSRYWPISHLEQWIPVLFAGFYLGGFLAILIV